MSTPFLDAANAIGSLAWLFKMNEASGTTMTDTGGSDGDGSYVSGPTLNQTALSLDDGAASVLFDGTNDYAEAERVDGGTPIVPPFSLVCILKTTDTDRKHAVVYGRTASSADQYGIGLDADGAAIANATNGTIQGQAKHDTLIDDGERHLLAGVFASTTSRKVYVDGESPVEDTTSVGANSFGFPRYLRVARATRSAGASDAFFDAAAYLNANVEYVCMFGKALSDADVLSLYNALLPWAQLFTESVTVADDTGGSPDNTAELFSEVTVSHPDSDNLTASLVIADTSVADITGSLPSGWTDAGSGTYTATARTPAQMQTDLRALSVAGETIGTTTATLTLTDEGSDTSVVAVDLETVDTDFSITVTPGDTVDFGTLANGTQETIVLTIENTGSADLDLDESASAITGTNAANFVKSSGWGGASSVIIAAGSSIQRAVTFNNGAGPLAAGDYTATLTIETDDPNNPSYALTLEATVLAASGGGGPTVSGNFGINHGIRIGV